MPRPPEGHTVRGCDTRGTATAGDISERQPGDGYRRGHQRDSRGTATDGDISEGQPGDGHSRGHQRDNRGTATAVDIRGTTGGRPQTGTSEG